VLSNAYKYSPKGGEVVIHLLPSAFRDGQLMSGFSIEDSGIGMSPEQLARVCERFYRADTSGRIPGTGLGMSIVKEIVELHRGEVNISSKAGNGTTVEVLLPVSYA
jgi:signal transduction histidine kinase